MAKSARFIDILSLTREGNDICILSDSTGEQLSIYEVDDFDEVIQIYAEFDTLYIIVDA